MSSRAITGDDLYQTYPGLGNTPLINVTDFFDTGLCEVFVKVEAANLSELTKIRAAAGMIQGAKLQGLIRPGGPKIIEATSGNTGVGLAYIASQAGLGLEIYAIDKMPVESIRICEALGASVILCDLSLPATHPESYHGSAVRAKERTGGFYIDQFSNPDNPRAHEVTTGPEIFNQMDGKVDAIVCAGGTFGTLAGIARHSQSVSPSTQIILADPIGSVSAPYIRNEAPPESAKWKVVGAGMDEIVHHLKALGPSAIHHAFSISDDVSYSTANQLNTIKNVSAGTTAGMIFAAALEYCQRQERPLRVVAVLPDGYTLGGKQKYEGIPKPGLGGA